jgi:hypothetical protein
MPAHSHQIIQSLDTPVRHVALEIIEGIQGGEIVRLIRRERFRTFCRGP